MLRASPILVALLIALVSTVPLAQATSFSQSMTFGNITVTVSGNISVDTTAKTISGTLTVTAVNDTSGKTIFQNTFMFSFSFASTGKTNFVLMIPSIGLLLTASCMINPSDGTTSCVVSKNPDVDHDGVINVLDLAAVASHYGTSDPTYDINNRGVVDITDLAVVAVDYNAPILF